MANLTQENLRDIGKVVDSSIIRLVPPMIETVIKPLRDDITMIKQVQTLQSSTMKFMQQDIEELKQSTRKLGILYEDLEHRFRADDELHGVA